MLTHLHLHQIGPAPDLEAEFGDRLNLVTGDNGLGKTFLLDACWFALTRMFPGNRDFHPSPDAKKSDPPVIACSIRSQIDTEVKFESEFQFGSQQWRNRSLSDHSINQSLVLYARIDGGFSIWEPVLSADGRIKGGEPIDFSNNEVWNGLPAGAISPEETRCNGFLRDVENWRLKNNGDFEILQKVLKHLSVDATEVIQIGEGVRLGRSVAEVPTLLMPYGKVPVTVAASGMKRVLALAYLLVWAWREHRISSELRREEPTRRMVLLFDEVEAHLHPKWQRIFLPALHEVVRSLLMKDEVDSVQIIATTHSPLVMGSVEELWDNEQDRLFDFDLIEQKVEFAQIPFAKLGSAEHWLESNSFDLPSSYPVMAQKAIEAANNFMAKYPMPFDAPWSQAQEVHQKLRNSLGGDDEYWPRWKPYLEHIKQPS
jgi:predicted ATPase